MRIAILEAQGIDSHHLRHLALRTMFPDADIVGIQAIHINPNHLTEYNILILPGIIGEDSLYPDILPAEKAICVTQAIQENGLILWTECASTYYLFDHYHYTTSNGQIKNKNGLGLFKGIACGPAFSSVTRRTPHATSRFANHIIADIQSNNGTLPLPYQALDVNGPTLHPSPNNKPFSEIFRYTNLLENPICGLIQQQGNGLVMAFSFHAAIPFDTLPFAHHGQDENRTTFMHHQANRIRHHIN
ncbi:MAG: hypothetical protein KDJ26_08020 [Alphaproteobacteria bacterium]|jgi:glutamine amidotransferase-like uncharacterized protein|nr:hypothetical protein [Alphaproteobacteria bacterium]MCB1551927.1 hypothetical protein [Alphaproteobacteria bacterium]MCB9985056.1 hypothetical protein [Micavibrio sp.]HRK97438.1 hypothetical protein [Alphaproteobacteria bacterium]